MNIGIVVSQTHRLITEPLLEGVKRVFPKESLSIYWVPGCFEIPYLCAKVIDKHDALITIGLILQGETEHHTYLANCVFQSIQNIQIQAKKPIGLGVLTCHTLEQAFQRAGGKSGNKGEEAARAIRDLIC